MDSLRAARSGFDQWYDPQKTKVEVSRFYYGVVSMGISIVALLRKEGRTLLFLSFGMSILGLILTWIDVWKLWIN